MHTSSTRISTLSLHDALPISLRAAAARRGRPGLENQHRVAVAVEAVASGQRGGIGRQHTLAAGERAHQQQRSEEHTSELQSLRHLVCRLLLEKKKQHELSRCW